MLRSMDSAVSGLRAHQNKLDVIGHNIANVNTNGFKSQSYTFKDTMYQTSTASTNGTATAGGVNAAQYGYGALMGVISMDMTASTPTYKGGFNATIDGSGFFVTNTTKILGGVPVTGTDDVSLKKNDFGFTRVGQFNIDSNGYITDGNGNFVYGFRTNDDGTKQSTKLEALRVPCEVNQDKDGNYTYIYNDTDGPVEAIDVQINKMGDIQISVKHNYQYEEDDGTGTNHMVEKTGQKTSTITIGQVAVATFQNEEGLTKDGNGYYVTTESDNTGTCSAAAPGDGRSTLMPGYLEASNVDMATEFAEMIMTQRGFQANSKIITVSDEILNDLINMKR